MCIFPLANSAHILSFTKEKKPWGVTANRQHCCLDVSPLTSAIGMDWARLSFQTVSHKGAGTGLDLVFIASCFILRLLNRCFHPWSDISQGLVQNNNSHLILLSCERGNVYCSSSEWACESHSFINLLSWQWIQNLSGSFSNISIDTFMFRI